MRSFFCALAALALFAAPAAAQSERPHGRLPSSISVFRLESQDFTQFGEFPLYGATATFEAPHSLEGAPFFEFGGGVGIFRNFSVGRVVRLALDEDPGRSASRQRAEPDFDRSPSGLRRRQRPASSTQEGAFHLQGIWHIPVTVEFEVAVFGGPEFLHCEARPRRRRRRSPRSAEISPK